MILIRFFSPEYKSEVCNVGNCTSLTIDCLKGLTCETKLFFYTLNVIFFLLLSFLSPENWSAAWNVVNCTFSTTNCPKELTLERNLFFLQPCKRTNPVPGDGIDNDCDGKIDEELCTPSNNKKGNSNQRSVEQIRIRKVSPIKDLYTK